MKVLRHRWVKWAALLVLVVAPLWIMRAQRRTMPNVLQIGEGGNAAIFSLAYSPDGKTLAVSATGREASTGSSIELWDTQSRALRLRIPTLQNRHLVFSPDSQILAGDYCSASITIWNAASGRSISTLPDNGATLLPTLHLPNAVQLDSGEAVMVFAPNNQTLLSIIGRASGHGHGQDGEFVGWNIERSNVETGIFLGSNTLACIGDTYCGDTTPSPDTQYLAVACSSRRFEVFRLTPKGFTQLWGMTTSARQGASPNDAPSSITIRMPSALFSSDSQLMVVDTFGSHPEVRVTATGKLISRIQNDSFILRAAISPSRKWVATADKRRRLRLWDTRSGKLIRTLSTHFGDTLEHSWNDSALVFSPDSATLAAANDNGTVTLWRVK